LGKRFLSESFEEFGNLVNFKLHYCHAGGFVAASCWKVSQIELKVLEPIYNAGLILNGDIILKW
jgi:hypothetical protein